ncbi:hypothetical protein SAMN05660443_2027 [Marinospirillum celere]|uniref:Uncharacterized protein n=1 Tax=Marinospirillum celere TaxID=1122252 RepID=A0A1I1I2P0_9GAMM|nr:hypothetical protein [Marinospirillum celere]SFC27490.1 hypothetical protein SAMN05660443_2027 [Marinospirillum celere]
MKCIDAQRQLEHLDLQQQPGALLAEHLENCNECLSFHQDHQLQLHLQSFRVIGPDPDFINKALNAACQEPSIQPRKWTWPASMAASFVLVALLLTGWLVSNEPTNPLPATPLQVDSSQPEGQSTQQVRILIISDQDYSDAEISLALAGNLQLEGYANQRELTWRTQLKAGQNLLTLPIQVLEQGGELQVSSRFGDQKHQVIVNLEDIRS